MSISDKKTIDAVAMPQPDPLARHYRCSEQFGATLAHYGAGGRQPRHRHDHTQVSYVLSGRMLETLDRVAYEPGPEAIGLKPAGAVHDDHWGPEGVLIFSIRLGTGEMEDEAIRAEPGWTKAAEPGLAPRLVRTFLSATTELAREEALWDMLALRRLPLSAGGRPPPWLARARAAIEDAPGALSVAEAAQLGGVHRVHFSRLFRQHFGAPPSIYRRRLLVSRAVAEVIRTKEPLSRLALDVGFSDQAHLSRAIARDVGLPPGLLRSLFRAATSVQEAPTVLA